MIKHIQKSSKDEKFRDIEGYEDYYQISNKGKIKSLSRRVKTGYGAIRITKEKILDQHNNRYGYPCVMLNRDGNGKHASVHRLVTGAFVLNLDGKLETNHLNGDKTDNRAENLEWCTNQENHKHAVENDLYLCQKPVAQFDLEGNLLRIFNSVRKASRQLGIVHQSISRVCLGQRKKTGGFVFKHVNPTEAIYD